MARGLDCAGGKTAQETRLAPAPFEVVWIAVQVLACVLFADLLTGFFHWLEDSYGDPSWPLVGPLVIEPNLEHHARPRAMVVYHWWETSKISLALGAAAAFALSALDALGWRAALVIALSTQANEIHKWTHRTRRENPAWVNWLHDRGLVQTPRHHGQHHGHAKDTHYCTLTLWLNPVLDRVSFWRALELAVRLVSGARPRGELAAR
jgi:plasmanylethanolamine desaturase